MQKLSQKTIEFIKKQDDILNKKAGWQTNNIKSYVNKLIEFGKVEVGYRACCGATDFTQKTYDAWNKVVKKMKAEGFTIKIEAQKHNNGWATNNDGFWNSNTYTIEK